MPTRKRPSLIAKDDVRSSKRSRISTRHTALAAAAANDAASDDPASDDPASADEDKVAEFGRLLERVKVVSEEEAEEFLRNRLDEATVLDIRMRQDGSEQADVVPNGRKEFDHFQQWLRYQAKRLDDALRADTRRTVVVHCKQGRNRSPLVVVAYLRIYKAVKFDQVKIAYEVLRRRTDSRKKTDPTKFRASLELLETC
jgi:hypothetical protein